MIGPTYRPDNALATGPPVDSVSGWIEGNAVVLVLGLSVPGADSEFESPVGQEVDGGRLSG